MEKIDDLRHLPVRRLEVSNFKFKNWCKIFSI